MNLFILFFYSGIVIVHRHNETWENLGERYGWTLELYAVRLRNLRHFEENIERIQNRTEFNAVPEVPVDEFHVRNRSDTKSGELALLVSLF